MSSILKWAGYSLNIGKRTHIMGILNVTPDSFSDGGRYLAKEKAIAHGLEMAADGADIIDVGGESTRPYSEKVSASEEIDRVVPVIEALKRDVSIPISIDTRKSEVAKEALKAGASMVNDVSALTFDPLMAKTVSEAEVPVVLMHMKGSPETMQDKPVYDDLLAEIIEYLESAIKRALDAGIREDLTIVDPGIGFAKTFEHNLRLINRLSELRCLNRPILLGTSNKAFIGHLLDKDAAERDTGSMATVAAGIMRGADIVRVHDVKKARDTVIMIDAVMKEKA